MKPKGQRQEWPLHEGTHLEGAEQLWATQCWSITGQPRLEPFALDGVSRSYVVWSLVTWRIQPTKSLVSSRGCGKARVTTPPICSGPFRFRDLESNIEYKCRAQTVLVANVKCSKLELITLFSTHYSLFSSRPSTFTHDESSNRTSTCTHTQVTLEFRFLLVANREAKKCFSSNVFTEGRGTIQWGLQLYLRAV